MARTPRRSQGEKSEATQLALYEATMSLLLRTGYTRLRTEDVASLAGMSRGALTHHFHNKEDLVVRSVAYNLGQVTQDLRAFLAKGEGIVRTSDEITDYLWDVMSGGLFFTVLEYLPEARHNEVFRNRLLPGTKDFHAALDAVWRSVAEVNGLDPDVAGTTLNATLCLMRGMVAQSVLRPDAPYFEAMLDHWKGHLRSVFASARASGPRLQGPEASPPRADPPGGRA